MGSKKAREAAMLPATLAFVSVVIVRVRLSDEQQFAVLGKRPHLVVNHQLELIDVISNLVE